MDGQQTDWRGAGTVLRRKTAAPAAEGARLTPERAMRIAFGRAASDFPAPGLRLTSFSFERTGVAALAAACSDEGAPAADATMPEGAMTVLLARDGRAGGALLAEADLVSALVEAETTGRLAKTPPEPRAATRLDLLVVSRLLDGALAAFDELGAGLSIAPAACGWRLGALLPGPAALPLELDEVPLRLMKLGFAFGARSGRLWLATPLHPPRRQTDVPDDSPALAQTVLAARAEVRAVLARLELPLDALGDWQPGTTLPIERGALNQVRLEDLAGATVARGRLGQINGARAVRLAADGEG